MNLNAASVITDYFGTVGWKGNGMGYNFTSYSHLGQSKLKSDVF